MLGASVATGHWLGAPSPSSGEGGSAGAPLDPADTPTPWGTTRPLLGLASPKDGEEKGPRWRAGAPHNPSRAAPSAGPLGAVPCERAGGARSHPVPWEEQTGAFLLIHVDFLEPRGGFQRGLWGRGVRGGGSMANLPCEWSRTGGGRGDRRGGGSHIFGIPSSGWAPSPQTLRMWEMEDERSCISSLSGYNV